MKACFVLLTLPLVISAGIAGVLLGEQKGNSARCDFVSEERAYVCKNIAGKFPDVFYGHYQLRCEGCNFPIFRKELFPYNNDLLALNLSHSSIARIASNAFHSFSAIRDLWLQHNNLKELDTNAFSGLRQVFELHLEHNQLTQLKHKFANAFEASSLFLSYNQLREIHANVFEGILGLMNLDLSHNRIGTLHLDSFAYLKGLEYLNLNDNELCSLPLGVFRHLTLLKELNLSQNRFKKFQIGSFSGLINLFALNISHNALNDISPIWLTPIDQLTVLDVSATTIDYLDVMELQSSAPFLKRIALSDNTWSCRTLENIVRLLRSKNIAVGEHDRYEVTNIKGIACAESFITEERVPFGVFFKYAMKQTQQYNGVC